MPRGSKLGEHRGGRAAGTAKPTWLKPVAPVDPDKRPPVTPPVAKSGAETEAQRQRVNSDKTIEYRVMGSAPRATGGKGGGLVPLPKKIWPTAPADWGR